MHGAAMLRKNSITKMHQNPYQGGGYTEPSSGRIFNPRSAFFIVFFIFVIGAGLYIKTHPDFLQKKFENFSSSLQGSFENDQAGALCDITGGFLKDGECFCPTMQAYDAETGRCDSSAPGDSHSLYTDTFYNFGFFVDSSCRDTFSIAPEYVDPVRAMNAYELSRTMDEEKMGVFLLIAPVDYMYDELYAQQPVLFLDYESGLYIIESPTEPLSDLDHRELETCDFWIRKSAV